MGRADPVQKKLTDNQIKGLHPAVRVEFKKKNLNDDEAHRANRLVRPPYSFKSRIALRAVREKLTNTALTELRDILAAMPKDAPAQLLENMSFAVLAKSQKLDYAIMIVETAAEKFRDKKKALAAKPKPVREPKPPVEGEESPTRNARRPRRAPAKKERRPKKYRR
jgi:hypothetical protein